MNSFIHEAGNLYLIMDGVRRAKAAQLHGHDQITAEIVDGSGISLGNGYIPLDALLSPKRSIRRITSSDQNRWERVIEGASHATLPFPPIVVQPTKKRLTRLVDVEFEIGEQQ
ncbi:MAG: hypothetical protein HYX68_00180 [Planctomycetes bacterium]|nr:hypothetical protein [Planctomycetota bacterium]